MKSRQQFSKESLIFIKDQAMCIHIYLAKIDDENIWTNLKINHGTIFFLFLNIAFMITAYLMKYLNEHVLEKILN